MEANTKKLTEGNEQKFFDDVQPGMVFTYSSSFDPKEVSRKAAKKNVQVEYCSPGTPEYKKHGSFTMKVISISNEQNN